MNLPRLTPSLTAAAMVCLAAGFSACESNSRDAYFAEASQSSTAVDLHSGASGRTGPAVEGTGKPEGIGQVAGHHYYIRDGVAQRLYQRQRFAQGYWIDRKGRIIASDGSIVLLRNREMVTFAGEHLPIPPGVVFP